jgi:ABC-type sulfate/molybdate transport systems ATPase subunit
LSLQLDAGKSLAVVGASGSGKSTLLRLISGLEAPSNGEVVLNGSVASVAGGVLIPPHRRNVAMLFQDAALWPNLSVGDNVALGLAGQRLTRAEVGARTAEALDRCEIADLRERLPRTLSGGQQQRAALARALAVHPKLLLLDEPFGGLDLLTRHSVAHQVRSLKSELGLTLIVVTHDPWEIELLCDAVAVLDEGRIAEAGSMAELARNPQTPLARALVERR